MVVILSLIYKFLINGEFDFGKIVTGVGFLVGRARGALCGIDVPRLKELKSRGPREADVSE